MHFTMAFSDSLQHSKGPVGFSDLALLVLGMLFGHVVWCSSVDYCCLQILCCCGNESGQD